MKAFNLKDRTFLESERFDRVQNRIGIITLASLDNQFIGELKSWSKSAKKLLLQEIINLETYQLIQKIQFFGDLTGNTDMHFWNLSFYSKGEKILGLAPIYDMLPMLYFSIIW